MIKARPNSLRRLSCRGNRIPICRPARDAAQKTEKDQCTSLQANIGGICTVPSVELQGQLSPFSSFLAS